ITSPGVPARPVSRRTVLSPPTSRYWHMKRSPRSDSLRCIPGNISILPRRRWWHHINITPTPRNGAGIMVGCVREERRTTMYLSRHETATGPRWALDERYLPQDFTLQWLLEVPAADTRSLLERQALGDAADDVLLPPVEPGHEIWASGVTYLQSKDAREVESSDADAYDRVYVAERPELFFKALGWRAVGHGETVRVREDSHWNVPEPELVLIVNSRMEVVGYTAGNDVSSRDIEGENPLYLPQAKVYDGSCSLGPGIVLLGPEAMLDLHITMSIRRGETTVFEDEIETSQMKRTPEELAAYLGKELAFPGGAFLMTGNGIRAENDFTLKAGDVVGISGGDLLLENEGAQAGS